MLMEREMQNVTGRHDFPVCESISVGVNRMAVDRDSIRTNGLSSGNAVAILSSYGVTCIEHSVSKMDTLAGVAIKYGVEVADIKKMNGLVTDLQMFGLKTLKIPLPGKHPPSPCLSNGFSSTSSGQGCSERAPNRVSPRDLSESFQSLRVKSPQRKVSPAMSSLQGYYRLKLPELKYASEGFEMAVYRKGSSESVEDGPISKSSSHSELSLSQNLKSRHLINSLSDENGELFDFQSPENFISQQHGSADFCKTSDVILKEDSSSNSGGFLSKAGKGLALRPKSACKAALASDIDRGGLNPISINLEESICSNGVPVVRKSSSTSSLQDHENGSSSSIWSASKWSLKQDLQALSAAAMARPIFDGLPKPIMTGRRNKAALD